MSTRDGRLAAQGGESVPKAVSAGLLLYRWGEEPDGTSHLEVLLVHPGGPYFARKDAGVWSIPKGEVEADERAKGTDLIAVALREVREETGLEPPGPFQPLGGVKAHHHKIVYAWAAEHDCDSATIVSNTFSLEWPPRSGKTATFPEVDRAAFFDLSAAREAIVPAQRRFINELEAIVGGHGVVRTDAPAETPSQ
jgi:predicted NUDIX family NTP pyrophosphohydrolase